MTMKVIILIVVLLLMVWPVISWMSYHIAGWSKWEKLYQRGVTNDNDLASSVGLKKF